MTGLERGATNSWASGSLWEMSGRAQVVTFIGAGGKTTCLRSITQEIDSAGLKVIATTTTKVFPAEHIRAWKDPNYPPPHEQQEACFWYAKAEAESGKWIGPSRKVVDDAIREDLLLLDRKGIRFEEHGENSGARTSTSTCSNSIYSKRFWMIEGDGARGRKLKCWGHHEPQIPVRSDCAVLVLDGGLWGRDLQADQVHRSESCPDLLGHVFKAEKAWHYFLRSPVFAPQYEQMAWVILLNRQGDKSMNDDLMDLFNATDLIDPLQDLRQRWTEIYSKDVDPKNKPRHLRLAAGDAKEGKIQWCDLW